MKLTALISLFFVLSLPSCAHKKEEKKETDEAAATQIMERPGTLTSVEVAQLTTNWDQTRKDALNKLVEKYGRPNEGTESMLIWHNNGPWKKSVFYNEPSAGMLEQFATMVVPKEKLSDLALFNKSVTVDKKAGLISARSNSEEHNFLALNLSKEIIDGYMTAMEARRQYFQLTTSMQRNHYMDGLNFGERAPGSVNEEEEDIE